MTDLTLERADAIIAVALFRARELQLKPVTVAVLDAGGNLIALKRQDGSSNLRPAIAVAKASGALALGVSSRKIGEMAVDRPPFIASVAALSPGGIVPAAGGVIIAAADGRIMGAVGVTGDTSDNDELCAIAGAEGAGLRPM